MNKIVQYDQIGPQYVLKINPTKEYALLPTILKMTGSIRNKNVLDLGCGDGYFTRQLLQYNPHTIVGIDISSTMIELAKKHKKNNRLEIQYQIGNALTINFINKFDLCIAIYLLDYAATKDELLLMCRNIYSSLKPGGVFATITFIPKTPRKSYFLDWKIISPQEKKYFSDGDEILIKSDPINDASCTIHCFYWSEQTYTECLKQAGFATVKWNHKLSVSKEGKLKYTSQFWEEVQKNTAGVGIKAIK